MRSNKCRWAIIGLALGTMAIVNPLAAQQLTNSETPPVSPPAFSFSDYAAQETADSGTSVPTAPPINSPFNSMNSADVPNEQINSAAAAEAEANSQDQIPDVPTTANSYPFGANQSRGLAPMVSGQVTPVQRPPAQFRGSNSAPDFYAQDNMAQMTDEPQTAPADSISRFDPIVQAAVHVDMQNSATAVSQARQLIEEYDLSQWSTQLPGSPVSLTDALMSTGWESRGELVRSYWNVFEKWATHVTVLREAEQLAALSPSTNRIEQELLESAKALVSARLIETEIELESAQRRLQGFVPGQDPNALPLAYDLPLVDEYLTQIDSLGQWVAVDPRLSQIDRMLPKSLSMLRARGDAATRCRQVVDAAISACNQNQLALGSALEAIRMCRESHMEFLRTVSRYNLEIAEYAIAVAPLGHPAHQLASMLIKTRKQTSNTINAVATGEPVRSAVQQSAMGSAPRNLVSTPIESTQTFGSVQTESTNPIRGSLREGNESKELSPWAQPEANSAAIGSGVGSAMPPVTTQTANLQPPPITPAKQTLPKTGGGGSFSLGNR